MKKKMQAAIAISLVIFCLLGCGDSSAKESCSKVDCKIMLEKDWSTFCVYSSETEMLLALECKNDDTEDAYRSIGAETRAFILYDLEEEEIKRNTEETSSIAKKYYELFCFCKSDTRTQS